MSACTCGQRSASALAEAWHPCPVHPMVHVEPPDLAAIRARHEYDARMNADRGALLAHVEMLERENIAITETFHADRGALLAALDEQTQRYHALLDAEQTLGAAYVRLRSILDAFDTPYAPTGEQIWAHTEAMAREMKAALDAMTRERDAFIEAFTEAKGWMLRSIRHDARRLGDGDEYATPEEHNAEVKWLEATADRLLGRVFSGNSPSPNPSSTAEAALDRIAGITVEEVAVALSDVPRQCSEGHVYNGPKCGVNCTGLAYPDYEGMATAILALLAARRAGTP